MDVTVKGLSLVEFFWAKVRELFQPSRYESRLTRQVGDDGTRAYFFNDLTTDKVGVHEFLVLIDGGDFLLDFGFAFEVSAHRLALLKRGDPIEPPPYFDFQGPRVTFVVQDTPDRASFWDAVADEVADRASRASGR